eukprot:3473626-Pyramimonas_sp.AAC.1
MRSLRRPVGLPSLSESPGKCSLGVRLLDRRCIFLTLCLRVTVFLECEIHHHLGQEVVAVQCYGTVCPAILYPRQYRVMTQHVVNLTELVRRNRL